LFVNELSVSPRFCLGKIKNGKLTEDMSSKARKRYVNACFVVTHVFLLIIGENGIAESVFK